MRLKARRLRGILAIAMTVVSVAGIAATCTTASAGDYPNAPIKMIVSVPPGGSVDRLARIMGDKLREDLGQPIVIENRPGASNNIGMELVARAAPDGYTILFSPGAPLVINKLIFDNLPYDPDSLLPISRVATNPIVMIEHPSVPAKTLDEFIAYAKAHPDQLNYASGGNGGIPHLTAEMFKLMAGVQLTKVNYKGVAPAVTGLLGGEVHVMFVDISTAIPHIRSGALRVLGVASAARDPALPNVPAFPERFPGLISETWFCMAAPPKTPRPIIDKLSAAAAKAVKQPDVRKLLEDMGDIQAVGSTPEEMAAFMGEERGRWAKVIQVTGIKAAD